MTDYPALFQQGTDTNETLANIINQLITAAKERAVASGITYDNATSGLLATEVKAAIDELVVSLALKAPLASPLFTGEPKAPPPSADWGIANKQWVESVLPDISDRIKYPNWTNPTNLSISTGTVQQAPSNGFLFVRCKTGDKLRVALCEANGTITFTEFLVADTISNVAATLNAPVKSGQYFKVTSKTETPDFIFIPEA